MTVSHLISTEDRSTGKTRGFAAPLLASAETLHGALTVVAEIINLTGELRKATAAAGGKTDMTATRAQTAKLAEHENALAAAADQVRVAIDPLPSLIKEAEAACRATRKCLAAAARPAPANASSGKARTPSKR